jgi:hypothetical protein
MTYDEGRDEMLAVFKSVWGTKPAVYPDTPSKPPKTEAAWARVNLQHAGGGQGSLTGGSGTTLYDRTGILWIEIYTPKGDGKVSGYTLAELVVNAYEDYSGPVLFRNVRLEEGGDDGAFTSFDVKMNFEYSNAR